MTAPADPSSVEAIAARLIALRIALGYEKNQTGFAEMLGMTPQKWNNYERLRRRPALDEAMKIREVTGASLDWIYYGVVTSLPLDLAERLGGGRRRLKA